MVLHGIPANRLPCADRHFFLAPANFFKLPALRPLSAECSRSDRDVAPLILEIKMRLPSLNIQVVTALVLAAGPMFAWSFNATDSGEFAAAAAAANSPLSVALNDQACLLYTSPSPRD